MLMEKQKLYDIITYLKVKKGVDFSGYRFSILERRVQKRLFFTNSDNFEEYYEYVTENPAELNNLFDVLALNVSHFFRNAFVYEFLRKSIIPDVLNEKRQNNDKTFRIWSTGCSNGEEPYSVAIILKEILDKQENDLKVTIFATDIDEKSLEEGKKGRYKSSSLKNVKYGILNKYFLINNSFFTINSEIQEIVKFSFFDLIDKKSNFPVESIYGGFDIVFCRNVLIYYEHETQKTIFEKLYRSLNNNGYLVLGEAESIPQEYKTKFRRENSYVKIFKKKEM